MFYVFDSHSRDERGLSVHDGKSVCLKFENLNEIESYIQVVYLEFQSRESTYFQLQFVDISVSNETKTSLSLTFRRENYLQEKRKERYQKEKEFHKKKYQKEKESYKEKYQREKDFHKEKYQKEKNFHKEKYQKNKDVHKEHYKQPFMIHFKLLELKSFKAADLQPQGCLIGSLKLFLVFRPEEGEKVEFHPTFFRNIIENFLVMLHI